MMEKQELIERYHDGTLDPDAQADVQRQMDGDPAFREEVELHGLALAAIRQEATARIRERLAQKGRELDAQTADKTRLRRWWPAAVGVLIMAVLVLVWWLGEADEQPAPLSPPSPRTVPPVQPSPMQPAAQPQPAAPSQPVAVNVRRLFASAFKAYRDDSLEPSSRSAGAGASPSERFLQAYWDGHHADALAAFDALGTTTQANDNLLFLRANSLLAVGRAAEAVPVLEGIARRDLTRFAAEVPWYLALARLRVGKADETRALLQKIADDNTAPHQADAKRLLEIWN